MLLSKTCEYGLRAAIYIAAKSSSQNNVKLEEICQKVGAPVYFGSKILQVLSRRGLISSQKGAKGGFYMTPEQANAPLIDLVVAIDGDQLLNRCLLGLRFCTDYGCQHSIHDKFKQIKNDILKLLREVTIGQMAEDLKHEGNLVEV